MNITVFGAAGNVGRRVVSEAINRGHEVNAVIRRPEQKHQLPKQANVVVADATDSQQVKSLSEGQDVVINATRPPSENGAKAVKGLTESLLAGIRESQVRLLVVGGAATLKVPNGGGRTVMEDAQYLPVSARHVAVASAAQQKTIAEEKQIDWVYLSPAASLVAGERTGQYRVGTDDLVVDKFGISKISIEDLAVALIDEAETPKHHRQRFTVAY